MQKIYDSSNIAAALHQSRYGEVLRNLDVPLFLVQYDKGELVTAPFLPGTWFQVVVQGSLAIYIIRSDGARYALSSGGRDYILGDMELFESNGGNIYTEASTPLCCLTLSLDENRDTLLTNNAFLQLIGASLAKKMALITELDAAPSSLSDRVLSYMRYRCPDGILKGVERTAFHLHCSPRQLQRILNRFTQEGQVEKIGKGTYRLL